MKKFFMFAAMASVVLASCVKNEPVATVEQGDLITFDAPVVAPATKATNNANAIAFPHTNFDAYAWYAVSDFDNETPSLYFSKKTFADKGDYWGATPAAYWPKNGNLTFVAYAPAGVVTSPACDKTELTFDYTVADAVGDQKDILYSDWVKNRTSANQEGDNKFDETGIDLPFHHALSAVNFKLKAASNDAATLIKIKSITLNDAKNEGTFTVTNANAASWSGVDGEADYAVLAKETGHENAQTITVAGATVGSEFILMPQTTSTTLSVEYYMSTEGGWIAQSTPVNFEISWEKGTRYTYTIVFSLDEIKLAPVVAEDWTPAAGADVPAVL